MKSNFQEYIEQILEKNSSIQEQSEKINDLIITRQRVLVELVQGFEIFLQEYEEDHPKQVKWHKTLKIAKKYIEQFQDKE